MKSGIITVVIVAILGVGGFFIFNSSDSENTNNNTDQTTNATQQGTNPESDDRVKPDAQNISVLDIASHNTPDDCWTIVEGLVYDITEYIPRHLGGDEILRACGADGTSLFTERTTDEGQQVGSGTPHSNGATSQLASFKLGELNNSSQ